MKKFKKDHIKYIFILCLIGLVLLIDTFIYKIPRIDNLILNIVVMVLSFGFVLLHFMKKLKYK